MTASLTVKGLVAAAPRATRTALTSVLLVVLAFGAYVYLQEGQRAGVLAFDFEGTLWEPALAIREARSPYPSPTVEALEVGNPALYPPPLMFAVLPLTVLPYAVGALAWISLLALGILASLWIVGVRDVRIYALALLSFPVVHGLLLGNATLLLVPLVALAWRVRAHSGRVGTVVGVAVATKLFLWPLVLWLVATGRYRATAVAGAAGAGALLAPWGLIGFAGLGDYPALLRTAEELFATRSWSLATVLAALGLSPWMAVRVAMLIGLLVALLAFPLARRRGDLAAFACVSLGAILASPIAWPSYYAILLVPLAVASARLSWRWLLVPLFWITPTLPRPRLDRADIAPGGEWCCPPPGVPEVAWAFNHAPPGLLPALASALLGISLVAALVVRKGWDRGRCA
jgi:hypothetical protein